MEQYAYLTLSLITLSVLVIMLVIRRDLIKPALYTGFLGGVAGMVAELFYFRDYWRPPSLVGIATISPEDFIMGFAVTALPVVAYLVIARKQFSGDTSSVKRRYFAYFLLYSGLVLLGMSVFNLWLGFNSVLVSEVLFIVLAGCILIARKDLLTVSAYSAIGATILMFVVYFIVFDLMFSQFWQKYWLLEGTRYGLALLGRIPVTEMLWYFSWAAFGSISFPFITKMKIINR